MTPFRLRVPMLLRAVDAVCPTCEGTHGFDGQTYYVGIEDVLLVPHWRAWFIASDGTKAAGEFKGHPGGWEIHVAMGTRKAPRTTEEIVRTIKHEISHASEWNLDEARAQMAAKETFESSLSRIVRKAVASRGKRREK